jgi:glycosyltransferase involved in cell wall biosynthesis
MNTPVTLSVVVLCYRSGNLIRGFVEQLTKEIGELNVTYELVLVANFDNEPDESTEIAKEIANQNPHCVVVAKQKEGRMGWDMRSGLTAARGSYIAIIDGDGQMPVSDIPIVFKMISTGYFDLVKTYRTKRFDGIYRKVVSNLYNTLFTLLYNPDFAVRDINSKPKIFTRQALDQMQLVSSDWFTDAEIMIEANRLKLRICDVATVCYKNERRASYVGLDTLLEFVYNLFYYRFKK